MGYNYDSNGKVICKPPMPRATKRKGEPSWVALMEAEAIAAHALGWGPGKSRHTPVKVVAPSMAGRLETMLEHANKIAAELPPLNKRKPNGPPAVLYVVVSDSAPGVVKIGITNNLERRVRAITTASGMKCVAVAAWGAREDVVREVEARAKAALGRRRTYGEWFRAPVKAFVRYVGMMVKAEGERLV